MADKKKPQSDLNPAFIQTLRDQRRSLGLIKFESFKDTNFSKWESKTENILIHCFGEKSNQIKQYRLKVKYLENHVDSFTMNPDYMLAPQQFKEQVKDLITVFIEELELRISMPAETRTSGIKVTTIVNQKMEIHSTISGIIAEIKEVEPDPARAAEAEKRLRDFEKELGKDKPEWASLKASLVWLLNFGRDAFIKVLPLLLEKYGKQ